MRQLVSHEIPQIAPQGPSTNSIIALPVDELIPRRRESQFRVPAPTNSTRCHVSQTLQGVASVSVELTTELATRIRGVSNLRFRIVSANNARFIKRTEIAWEQIAQGCRR